MTRSNLLPRHAGDGHDEQIELELMHRSCRQHHVRDMRWIEGSPEETNPTSCVHADTIGRTGRQNVHQFKWPREEKAEDCPLRGINLPK